MARAPIAVFFALSAESGSFEDLLQKKERVHAADFQLTSGTLEGIDFLSVLTGAGSPNARRTAETVCRSHQPRLVVSAGFAGSLNSSLQKHELFFPNEFLTEEAASAEDERLTAFTKFQAEHLPKELRTESHFGGRLLTVREVVTQPEAKRTLGSRFQARAADMESYAIADVCRELNLPFFSVRVISDGAEEPLPQDVQKLVQQKTTASRLGAALQMIVTRPASVRDLFGLYETSVESASRLAAVLKSLAASGLADFLSENFFPPQEPGRLLEAVTPPTE